jgi:hypothetical protein
MLLAVVGLFVASGAIGAALADDNKHDDNHPSTTLYTPPLKGANIICDAINVSDKTLDIVITILGADGVPITTNDPTNFMALPGTLVSSAHHEADPTNSLEGYCKFEVFGTRNRNDVRVDLNITLKRNIPDTTTPVWVFRQVEGH